MAQQKTTLYLPADLHRRLAEASRREKRSQADIVREALDCYLNEQPRRRFRSMGIVADGSFSGRDSEDRLREMWDEKWARKRARG